MIAYYSRLALTGFRNAPGLTTLMIGTLALGISACIVTLTLYDATSRNPIGWKSNRLYAVTMDSWDPKEPANPTSPDLPPSQMVFKDAKYLSRSNIPSHYAVMFRTQDSVSGGTVDAKPLQIATRVTSSGFFAMFDVPFLFGSAWNSAADDSAEPSIVLSKKLNSRLYGGSNSVGNTLRWNGHEFRVVGVLDDWFPLPKFYDLNRGAFDAGEDAYVPFGWAEALARFPNGGKVACWQNDPIDTFATFLQSDCVWLQMWVQLDDSSARERMRAMIEAYWTEQHASGRFLRPRNNRLTDVKQWLIDQRVVQNDNRLLVALAFAFLTVCVLNTVGLLLARFMKQTRMIGVRRALGATRGQIFLQYLTESGLLATAGALVGLGFGALGLWGAHAIYARGSIGAGGYQELTRLDAMSVLWTLVLAVLAILGVGLFPAWRISRLPAATYLKGG
ncbi:MAG: ABC transporter permease [Pseudomonadota bacterium]|nr:ABC transporter permease [Pseudomonadota bacterium]